ncbi:MAG: hypothetical protein VX733_10520 [Candidatus Latescibacterota bacterium]|nr:hypothetical protein [Candidatus Latescibacterota bacterium]
MPIFRSGPGQAPSWCEMESFDIVQLASGAIHVFECVGDKEKLIVAKGRCRIAVGDGADPTPAETAANIDLAVSGCFSVFDVEGDTTLVRMAGAWGDDLGGSGLFSGQNSDEGEDRGDPVVYSKHTRFDSHFHDCDEYWIIYEGSAEVVSEGRHYQVGPGDCVATGMGHHHDIANIEGVLRGVYFETTMEGQERRGHLWDHTHGKAEPKLDRV